ncbi:MAG: 6,7-dimethyl-8-ribityllumazine synthase [Phenylobacterium sp. SCN 70-31]|nr:MAG: 6,7-dimethyl-8-ribityllumazine synthase [Phenylobacterium sp. SCN 70-31]
MSDEPIRILIVEARFYDDLADALLDGAVQALTAFEAEYDVVTVPGALEIPGAIALAEDAGQKAGKAYDGYVALGCVIRGETYHFEIVSNESARGIMDLTVGKRLCIGNGVLTTEDDEQAWARARISEGDKGGGAARAALSMIALKRQLAGGLR